MTNSELLSKTISYLRFPLTVGVVFLHYNLVSNGFTIHGIMYGTEYPDWYGWLILFISDVLGRLCVPMFFLISGFLFFYRVDFNHHIYKQKLRKRVMTLFVPYLLWNIIAILYELAHKLPFLSSVCPNACYTEVHISFMRLFHTFFANFDNEGILVSTILDPSVKPPDFPYPIDTPLWFVRDLMVMVLLSPFIFWMIKRAGRWVILLLGIVWAFYQAVFMVDGSWPDGGWSVLLSRAAFFYSWGAYYSINKISFVDQMRKYKYAPLLYIPVAIADTLTKIYDFNIYIHEIGILIGIVSVTVVVSYLLENNRIQVNETLSNCSFFVFALHLLIMCDIGKLIFTILHLSGSIYNLVFLYFFVPLLTICICIILYIIIRRYMPKLCNLLTGGR